VKSGAAREDPYGRRRDGDEALDAVRDHFHPVVGGDEELAFGGGRDPLVGAEQPVDEVVDQAPCGAHECGRHDLVLDGLAVRLEAHTAVLPRRSESDRSRSRRGVRHFAA
jgi:hypothetical protein